MSNTIRTLKYGTINIAKDTTYLMDKILDMVEMDNGDFYEIRLTFNHIVVAVKI